MISVKREGKDQLRELNEQLEKLRATLEMLNQEIWQTEIKILKLQERQRS